MTKGGLERRRAATSAASCASSCRSAASTCARPAARKPLEPLHDGEDVMHGDLRDPAVVDRLLAGRRRAGPHGGHQRRAAAAGDHPEQPASRCTRSTKARAATGCGASSSRARTTRSACTRSTTSSGSTPTFRPDGFYGLSKVWGEAMARMYWDKHGIEGISLRIGTAMGRPPENRASSAPGWAPTTWCSS